MTRAAGESARRTCRMCGGEGPHPEHPFLRSVESVRRLADAAGFRILRIVFDSHSIRFWASEGHERDVPLGDPPKERGLDRPAWSPRRLRMAREAARLNREERGDQAAVVLVKAGAPGDGT